MRGVELDRLALLVVDAQQGFEDPRWGRRNNPACDANIAALVDDWRAAGRAVVYVRHDSVGPGSPLRAGSFGNQLKPYLSTPPDLLVTKSVNSAFHGRPDLHQWLRDQDLDGVVICGITTNHCCETTARVGANLGHQILFVLDATHTFDRPGPDGRTVPADELAYVTATNLEGEFAKVTATADLLSGQPPASDRTVRLSDAR